MLTIGQVATYLGVTVRAIRHYHQRGLLPEPERDSSGYRRYGPDAIVKLVRIRTLSEAGVPLARIDELMAAGPREFASSITSIDDDLKQQIKELRERRARIAELASGDRLFLPEEVVSLLELLGEIGLSPQGIGIERDTWILLAAQHPEQVPGWAAQKRMLFDDPSFQRLYRLADEAAAWDRDDPRLEEMADTVNAFGGLRAPDGDNGGEQVLALDALVAVTLMAAQTGKPVPAWERLIELCKTRAAT